MLNVRVGDLGTEVGIGREGSGRFGGLFLCRESGNECEGSITSETMTRGFIYRHEGLANNEQAHEFNAADDEGSPSHDFMENSILIAGLFSLSSPHFLGKIIQETARKSKSRLLIVLVSPLFNTADGVSHTESWRHVQTLLTFVYVQATAIAQELDNILLDVDVVLRGHDELISSDWANGMETLFRIQNGAYRALRAIPS